MSTLRRINAVLLVGLVSWAAWTYPTLPERFPIHFDLAGNPDGWSGPNPVVWFLLPLVNVLTSLGLYGTATLVRRAPHLLNVPRKKLFLELDEAGREAVYARVERLLDVVALASTLLLGSLQWAMTITARGAPMPVWVVGGAMVAYTVGVIWLAVRESRVCAELIERLHR